eukprot:NODE_450_length_1556_cov_333.331779.p1 GENE.NODE_450_length_1556_cov_333.331779~~NODE_450_length_1556_cov_333.331779.p1  ORF type:complete len:367 (+),score=69.60 NODE_450_length_1556_cov_333.331779:3-1103(+)
MGGKHWMGQSKGSYEGPISMLRRAYESTASLGSTTVLLSIMDNSTRIHGRLHPMIAVLSVGDCQILILRRSESTGTLRQVFQTDMQRIEGNCQAPLQLARVDDSIDPDFDESIAIEVIEKGSAVHCVSALEGDIVVLGSDGVFDNLFTDDVLAICNEMLCPHWMQQAQLCADTCRRPAAIDRNLLSQVARRIVKEAHLKADPGLYRKDTPIGRGGKVDDTSCVVGEVIEWAESHTEAWARGRRQRHLKQLMTCGLTVPGCESSHSEDLEESEGPAPRRKRRPEPPRQQHIPMGPSASFGGYSGYSHAYGDDPGYFRQSNAPRNFSTLNSSYDSGPETDMSPETSLRYLRPKVPYGCSSANAGCSIS